MVCIEDRTNRSIEIMGLLQVETSSHQSSIYHEPQHKSSGIQFPTLPSMSIVDTSKETLPNVGGRGWAILRHKVIAKKRENTSKADASIVVQETKMNNEKPILKFNTSSQDSDPPKNL